MDILGRTPQSGAQAVAPNGKTALIKRMLPNAGNEKFLSGDASVGVAVRGKQICPIATTEPPMNTYVITVPLGVLPRQRCNPL